MIWPLAFNSKNKTHCHQTEHTLQTHDVSHFRGKLANPNLDNAEVICDWMETPKLHIHKTI